jgi:hypothetical protein
MAHLVPTMTAHGTIRAAARRRRRQLIETSAARCRDGHEVDFAALETELERAAALSSVYAPWEWAISVAVPLFISIVVLVPLWFVRVPLPEVRIVTRASRITMELKKGPDVEVGRIKGARHLIVQGFDNIRSSTLRHVRVERTAPAHLEVVGGRSGARIHVPSVAAAAEAADTGELVVERSGARFMLESAGLPLHLNLTIEDPPSIQVGRTVLKRPPVGLNAIVVRADRSNGTQITAEGEPSDPLLEMRVLHPVGLKFHRVAFDDLGNRVTSSSILSGNIEVVATGRRRPLRRGDEVELGELDGELWLTPADGALEVSFGGTTNRLVARSGSRRHDLRPSLAEVISKDRNVAFLWSALVLLVGTLWTVRRVVRERPL